MKRHFLSTLAFLFSCLMAFAQGVPPGINYQAVARDARGAPLANHEISLKITLLAGDAGGKSVYEETHRTATNEQGLFNLVIGQGQTLSGDFTQVPWSEYQIWLQLALDEDGSGNYLPLSASRLMAVPYAFHAGTADNIKGDDGQEKTAAFWKVNGNDQTLPGPHFLGTLDSRDLVLKTTNQERMRIFANGNINMNNSLSVGVDVNVGRDVNAARDGNLGRNLDVANNARVGNDLAVLRNSRIKGMLELDSIVRVYFPLQSSSKDDGALVIEGGVGIEKNINIGGNSRIQGQLGVDSLVRFFNTLQSFTKDDGALVVKGGAGIEKNINVGGNSSVTGNSTVGGNSSVGGTLGVDGIATFNNTTESTSKDNGAVVIEGGLGVEKSLNVGGNTALGGSLAIDGILTVSNTTESTTKDNGALVVEGGAGIEKNINVGGNSTVSGNAVVGGNTNTGSLNVNSTAVINGNTTIGGNTTVAGTTGLNGQVTITAALPLDGSNYDNFPLRVQGSGQGIAVKVNDSSPNSDNNFVTFFDSNNSAKGTIEGMDANDLANWPPYIYETAILSAEVVAGGVNVGLSLLPNACAGLGVVACPPEPSVVAITIAEEILAIANLAAYQTFSFYYLGISYTTGSADYAEYLERRNPAEKMTPGDIVGVTGGKISKNTGNASQHMVISTNPAVLGNMPQPADQARFEKVAFMGQVPVKVRGQVNIGDYILPSGYNDGTGIAVSPERITAKQYSLIVGVAWSEAPADSKLSLINLAIGLNTNDVARLVEEQQSKIEKLERDFASLEQRLAALEAGTPVNAPAPAPVWTNAEYIDASLPVELDIAQINEAIVLLEDTYRAKGIDVDNHLGLKKLFSDEAFRMDIILKVQENYQNTRSNILKMEGLRR